MKTAVDSSVLILLLRRQAGWEGWRDALEAAASEGILLISPIAFAECSIGFPSAAQALHAMEAIHLNFDPISEETAYKAGQAFLQYRRAGGPREHLIPDFLIAAHAMNQADRLAAIDRGYLRKWFPGLNLLPS